MMLSKAVSSSSSFSPFSPSSTISSQSKQLTRIHRLTAHFSPGNGTVLTQFSSLVASSSASNLLPSPTSSSSSAAASSAAPNPLGHSLDDSSPVVPADPVALAAFIQQAHINILPTRMQFQGLNHLALVCEDMQETTRFWTQVLGCPLVKTIELPGGGQHFFFDIGNNACIAYFWWPNAPKAAPGIASIDPASLFDGTGRFYTAHGSMNHVAISCEESKLHEYRKRIYKAGVMCSPLMFHTDFGTGFSEKRTAETTFVSFYFFGPSGEYLEITSQTQGCPLGKDAILHLPRTASSGGV